MENVFFWGVKNKNAEFSQWFESDINYFGMIFNCCEQWMMWHKAMLFGDYDIADAIMKTKKPDEHKKLGRQIENFNEQIWTNNVSEIVKRGNFLKFTQNQELYNLLISKKDMIFVEASPYDKIYGIGLRADDLKAQDYKQWNGLNKLGFCLTDLKNDLLENKNNPESKDFLIEYEKIKDYVLLGRQKEVNKKRNNYQPRLIK